jgi:hypothetical protein
MTAPYPVSKAASLPDFQNGNDKGESITVTFGRKKKAVAIVSPVPTKGTKRPLGLLAGEARIAIADDWEIDESQFLGT